MPLCYIPSTLPYTGQSGEIYKQYAVRFYSNIPPRTEIEDSVLTAYCKINEMPLDEASH